MADSLLDRTIQFTMPKYMRKFQDGMAKMGVFYYWAVKKGLFSFNQGGRQIECRIRVRRGSPFGYTGGTEGGNFSVRNDYEFMKYDWKGIGHSIAVTKSETWQNKKPEQITALVPRLLEDMRDDLVDEFCTSAYGTGTRLNSATFEGIAATVGTGLSPGGLSSSTYSAVASQYVDGTGFLSDPFGAILDLKGACMVGAAGGRQRNTPDIILSPLIEWKAGINSTDAKRRFTSDTEMAKAGFPNVEAHGMPWAWDEYATASKVYALNSSFWEFVCGIGEVFETETEWLPGLPKLYVGYALSYLNLVNKNPRASGELHSTNL